MLGKAAAPGAEDLDAWPLVITGRAVLRSANHDTLVRREQGHDCRSLEAMAVSVRAFTEMKRSVKNMMLAAMLTAGCSAADEIYDEDQSPRDIEGIQGLEEVEGLEDAEISQLLQALTTPTNYGNFSVNRIAADGRCTGTWSAPETCMVPSDKILRFKDKLPSVQPFERDYRTAFNIALGCMRFDAGATWTYEMGGTSDAEAVQFGTLPPNTLAQASLRVGSVFIHNGLRYQKNDRCGITFDDAQIATATLGFTAAQKKNFITNVARMELCHCSGLGHNSPSVCRQVVNIPAWIQPLTCGFGVRQGLS